MNTYKIMKAWFSLSEKDHRIKPIHTALLFYIINLNNQLDWKKEFGLPAYFTCEALNVTYNTFSKALNFLVCDIQAVRLVEKSTNQYTSNIVSLDVLYQFLQIQRETNGKPNAKATVDQTRKQSESNSTIDKPLNLKKNKVHTSLLFYDSELKENINARYSEEFNIFVNILKGINAVSDQLTDLLNLEKQVSYTNFEKILIKSKSKQNGSIENMLMDMYNNPKYVKGRKSLYLILNNWLNSKT